MRRTDVPLRDPRRYFKMCRSTSTHAGPSDPGRGGQEPPIPSPDARAHRALLLTTLAFLFPSWRSLRSMPPSRRRPPRSARCRRRRACRLARADIGGPDRRRHRGHPARAPPRGDRACAGVTTDAVRFQAALEAARAAGGAYGVTFAAVRDGELLWSRRERTRPRRQTPQAGATARHRLVTKTYVAATILQLAEEGRLRSDRPACGVISRSPSTISEEITIAQLLDHTSGLADVFNDTTRAGLEEHPEHAWTHR